jgi:hypothetical protein
LIVACFSNATIGLIDWSAPNARAVKSVHTLEYRATALLLLSSTQRILLGDESGQISSLRVSANGFAEGGA